MVRYACQLSVVRPRVLTSQQAATCARFHSLPGTAATKFYVAGLPIRVIAEILAWSEDQVERIIRRYVARAAELRQVWSGRRESNPRMQLGKLPFYH